MGDSGEGLVDAATRLQERMEERRAERSAARANDEGLSPERQSQKESLRLAAAELTRQQAATTHPVRLEQIRQALADIERRLAEI